MSTSNLPSCGLYRTTEQIGPVPAGRLVFFHNHGDPGPGIYLPESWHLNRARFSKKGVPLPDEAAASTLEPLPPEGLYSVREPFHCCAKQCVAFQEDLLVQLGYNREGKPILFVPEWTEMGLSLPERGQGVEGDFLARLSPLKVRSTSLEGHGPSMETGRTRH